MAEKNGKTKKIPRLITRLATVEDIPKIVDLTSRVYPEMPPYRDEHIRGQINHFPQGQFVAVLDGSIVGYCATFRISGKLALAKHSWREITGGGFASRHDPQGDYLYGMEVCVDPDWRGARVGRRLYEARKALCKNLDLKGIVIVGRMPRLRKHIAKGGTADSYLEGVQSKKLRDPVLLFQMRNSFEVKGILPEYLPFDEQSAGYGCLMVWTNPIRIEAGSKSSNAILGVKQKVRLATVQYKQRKVTSFSEFAHFVEYFIDVAADYESDFVVFPEWFTMQLLSIENKREHPSQAIRNLARYTDELKNTLGDFAMKYNINIVGGSTATLTANHEIQNTAFVFLRDGTIHEQQKIHATPNEVFWWNLKGGDRVDAIETDCGPIGVLICYDSEFPELGRHLANQGVRLLFVPFCTDERKSYMRVRYCAQARAVENQMYVVLSGNCGNLPGVENMDIQYAQSCILTPSDFPFARDGVAADTTPNAEMIAFADVRMDDLIQSRNFGTVQNLRDRRHDLYHVHWTGKS